MLWQPVGPHGGRAVLLWLVLLDRYGRLAGQTDDTTVGTETNTGQPRCPKNPPYFELFQNY
jgi:hypothetical protein